MTKTIPKEKEMQEGKKKKKKKERKKEMQEGKVVVWGGFANSWKRKERAREKGTFFQLNAEFQRIAGEIWRTF